MIVKENERQLSFLFQEKDSYFEMGYLILKQAKLEGMLPYKRTQQNGKEKLAFQIKGLRKLSDILMEASEDEVIDILYAVVFMTQRVEENGFMKKECIWCRYENIYYDTEERKPLLAVLPITQEFRYADGASWMKGFEECLFHIADCLSEGKKQRVQQLITLLVSNQICTAELLEEMNTLGTGMAGMLTDQTKGAAEEKETKLELVYAGKEGTFCFHIEEDDFAIGRDESAVDGLLQLSAKVSRRHCLITKINRNYFVQDLNSMNGTYVNDIQIPREELMELEQNDVLRIADVAFRVHIIG